MRKYPLRFIPQEDRAIWGREFWLVSAYRAHPSIVSEGPYAGRSLPDLADEFGEELYGTKCAGPFPQLTKIIEAKDRLSIQVHPNEEASRRSGGDPKTEMWYVLGAAPGSYVSVGLNPGVARDDFIRALHDGEVEHLVRKIHVARGDVLLIPGGQIHSVGGGCRLYEIQQTSDTTWRLHDWNRIDPSTGGRRKTNEREGLASMDWSLPPAELAHCGEMDGPVPVKCPFFNLQVRNVSDRLSLSGRPDGFRILFVAEGKCAISTEGYPQVAMAADDSVLLPAGLSCEIVADGGCRMLISEP